jgi:hypothetical protein
MGHAGHVLRLRGEVHSRSIRPYQIIPQVQNLQICSNKRVLLSSEVEWEKITMDAGDLGCCWNGEHPPHAFTAYDCSNRSNIVKSYLLLDPDACAASGGNGEMETVH